MHSDNGRDELPDVSSIIEFSKRLRGGVSSAAAKEFLLDEHRFLAPEFEDYEIVLHVPLPRRFKWNIDEVRLRPSANTNFCEGIKKDSYELVCAHRGSPFPLNASVLEYFLRNQGKIPERWKEHGWGNNKRIFFWGTLYASPAGFLYVRFLICGHDGIWYSNCDAVDVRYSFDYWATCA